MKKKNIDLLFEAFQAMAKRAKSPLDTVKIPQYVSGTFKKFPKIKKTKILENQLREMIQEYMLLQQVNPITKREDSVKANAKEGKEIKEKIEPTEVISEPSVSKEPVHFLSHPAQRYVAAFGVLLLGLLLAIPLMENQSERTPHSFQESFEGIASAFKWEGPAIPSLGEVINREYAFVLRDPLPEIPEVYGAYSLQTSEEIISWIISELPRISNSPLILKLQQLSLDPKVAIVLKSPRLVFPPENQNISPSILFEATGADMEGKIVDFQYEVPLQR